MVTLKTAKELKENGFPQDMALSWGENHNGRYSAVHKTSQFTTRQWGMQSLESELPYKYAAPSFEEIWAQLPKIRKVNDEGCFAYLTLTCIKIHYSYWIDGIEYTLEELEIPISLGGICKAAAELWIKLKTDKII